MHVLGASEGSEHEDNTVSGLSRLNREALPPSLSWKKKRESSDGYPRLLVLYPSFSYKFLEKMNSRTQEKEKMIRSMMVNFTCQFGLAMVPNYLVKHYSGYFLRVFFG